MPDRPDNYELDVDIPTPGGLWVTTEQPYHMLLVSDLTGSEAGSLSGPLEAGVIDVKPDTFDDVMKAASPTVNYTTTDPLTAGGAMVEVNLRFDSLRAFDPATLARQIPGAKSLIDIREKLAGRMRGKLSDGQLSNAVAGAASSHAELAWLVDAIKWTPAAPTAAPDVVDNLLGQIDLGGEDDDASPSPKSPIGSIVSAAATGGANMPAEQVSAIRRALAEIDRRVGAWLTTVLHAPQVQSLEAAWRSLAFLISKIDFRKGVRLSVLHAPQASMLERFVSRLIDPVFDEGADAPDVIIVDRAFGNTAKDFEALDELAQHGASLPAVVIAGVSASFFGVKHAWQIPTLPTISNIFDQWQFAKWKSLREKPYARALGVVFGRCLLRQPYGNGQVDELEFTYREERMADKDLVWATGPIAIACAIGQSIAERGWPTAMSGYAHGRVEGFKTALGGKKGDKKFGPTDIQIPQPKIEEMAAVGLNAAVGIRDHDDALIWNGLTAARPDRMHPDAFLEVSLPYQLFAGRLAALLLTLKPHLAGKAPDAVGPYVKQHISDWLGLKGEATPEQISVQTRPAQDNPSVMELAVTVTPPQKVLPGGIPVVLGYRLT